VNASRLEVSAGGDIYWNANSFGANHGAFVTLTTVNLNASEISLLLKSQSSAGFSPGVIRVTYDPVATQIEVWTFDLTRGWRKHPPKISVTFVNGDQFGAGVDASGQVGLFRNGILLGSREIRGWPYISSGGYIGLSTLNADTAILDDFGGGDIGNP
jgi:hypothetical protein